MRSRHGRFRGNNPERPKNLYDALFRQSRHGYLSARVDLSGRERTDHGEPSGPRATLAASPCFFLWRSRPAIRGENELARNFWTQRRFVRLFSEIFAAVFPHSGGQKTKRGQISGRQCYFSRVGSPFAPPESKSQAGKKPIMANHVGSRHGHFRGDKPEPAENLHYVLFWQSRHRFLSVGVNLAGRGKTDRGEPSGPRATSAVSPWLFLRQRRPTIREENELARNFCTQRHFARASSHISAAAFPHSNGPQTKRGKIVGRRCRFGRVGSFSLRRIRPPKEKEQTTAKRLRGWAFRQHRNCVFPRGLTRAGGRKATLANQLRGVGATAQSPWPLSRKHAGSDGKSARCVILAASPWIIFRGG